MIRDLYIKSYESDNTNNYIIASNNPCIKDSSGRRYYLLEINTAKNMTFNTGLICAMKCLIIR